MKRHIQWFTFLVVIMLSISAAFGQEAVRKVVEVPKVDAAAITIDGQMDEAEWENAAKADMITDTGYEIWTNKYYRESLEEPDYDEMYGRMLWSKDTLFVFMHIDEIVNDSTDLYWNGQWTGDQLFISLSGRLGLEMQGWYDGNVYGAPEGPYHFWILGEDVNLTVGEDPTFVPEEWRHDFADSLVYFDANDICKYATFIDKPNGVWNVEMAIYNPNINAQSILGFNIGGSTGSSTSDATYYDAYGYFTWQPNVPDDPYAIPAENDPGYYNLASSSHWAILKFLPGVDEEYIRKEIDVPMVNHSAITIDGQMNEAEWDDAAKANMITDTGYEIWTNKYYRESLEEPDYDEMYARMLWSHDTLFVFMHIDEIVNDSTDLYWNGQWTGDQLFISVSGRLGLEMQGWYDGNVYGSPEGPYHFWILGEEVNLTVGEDPSFVPEEWRYNFADSLVYFDANDICEYATFIDKPNGVWNVEMAIHNTDVAEQSALGFNIGGSTGSSTSDATYYDAYGYFTWQPNVPDDPYAIPAENDPGYYNLASSSHWAVLNFVTGATAIRNTQTHQPGEFTLQQNYPNPFNPSTTIRFDVADKAPVTLTIFNAVGQKVTDLISNRAFSSGTYSVTWNAAGVASGVYFYQLKAGNLVQTRKMVLLK